MSESYTCAICGTSLWVSARLEMKDDGKDVRHISIAPCPICTGRDYDINEVED